MLGCACARMLREALEGLEFVSFFLWLQLFQATTEQTAPAMQSHFTSFHSKHFNRLVIFLCFEQASKHHLHLGNYLACPDERPTSEKEAVCFFIVSV